MYSLRVSQDVQNILILFEGWNKKQGITRWKYCTPQHKYTVYCVFGISALTFSSSFNKWDLNFYLPVNSKSLRERYFSFGSLHRYVTINVDENIMILLYKARYLMYGLLRLWIKFLEDQIFFYVVSRVWNLWNTSLVDQLYTLHMLCVMWWGWNINFNFAIIFYLFTLYAYTQFR